MTTKYRIYEYTYPTKHPNSLDPAGRWGSTSEAVHRMPNEYNTAGEAEAQCIKLFQESQARRGYRDYYWVEVLPDLPINYGTWTNPLLQAYINLIENFTEVTVDEVTKVSIYHNPYHNPYGGPSDNSVTFTYTTEDHHRTFTWWGTMPELLNELSGLNIHD